MTELDNAHDLELLADTPAQAEFLLYSLEQAASGIGLYVISDKMKLKYYNENSVSSSLNGKNLKLLYQIICIGSSILLYYWKWYQHMRTKGMD